MVWLMGNSQLISTGGRHTSSLDNQDKSTSQEMLVRVRLAMSRVFDHNSLRLKYEYALARCSSMVAVPVALRKRRRHIQIHVRNYGIPGNS
jgi:hypothetical protein